jgi:hypothetical protein
MEPKVDEEEARKAEREGEHFWPAAADRSGARRIRERGALLTDIRH